MTQQIISIGSNPNDGTGDPLRTAFSKTNNNFTEVYGDIDPTQTTATGALGYKGLPISQQNNAYTFLPSDIGKLIMHDEVTARTWTIAANATQAISVGAPIMLYNATSGGTLTISPAGGVTLRRADGVTGTGTRSVLADSLASIIQISTNVWIISGTFS